MNHEVMNSKKKFKKHIHVENTHGFRANHLVADSQLKKFSPGHTASSTP